MAMDIRSKMQCAELEIRAALKGSPGAAMGKLMEAYSLCDGAEKDAFVAALLGHFLCKEAAFATASSVHERVSSGAS
jgi:hypothetical protein